MRITRDVNHTFTYIEIYNCAKFHASIIKRTILAINVSCQPHYLSFFSPALVRLNPMRSTSSRLSPFSCSHRACLFRLENTGYDTAVPQDDEFRNSPLTNSSPVMAPWSGEPRKSTQEDGVNE